MAPTEPQPPAMAPRMAFSPTPKHEQTILPVSAWPAGRLLRLHRHIRGFALSVVALGIHPANYFHQTVNAILITDVVTGLVKACAFGVVITIVGAYQGFRVSGGAEEVGRRTTAAGVVSILLVIVFDLFFTTLFYYFT